MVQCGAHRPGVESPATKSISTAPLIVVPQRNGAVQQAIVEMASAATIRTGLR